MVGSGYSLAVEPALFRARCTYFRIHSSLCAGFFRLCLISILLFPCISVGDNTSARNPFPIAILNGIFLLGEMVFTLADNSSMKCKEYFLLEHRVTLLLSSITCNFVHCNSLLKSFSESSTAQYNLQV